MKKSKAKWLVKPLEKSDKQQWIHVEGSIGIPKNMNEDDFFEKFITAIEKLGWCFAGVLKEEEIDEEA